MSASNGGKSGDVAPALGDERGSAELEWVCTMKRYALLNVYLEVGALLVSSLQGI